MTGWKEHLKVGVELEAVPGRLGVRPRQSKILGALRATGALKSQSLGQIESSAAGKRGSIRPVADIGGGGGAMAEGGWFRPST